MSMDSRRGPSLDASGRRRAARPGLETLEGKALMSHGGLTNAGLHTQDVIVPGVLPVDISIRRFNQPGPIRDIIGPGFATKIARFNGYYVGPVGFPATTDATATNAPAASTNNGYLNATGAKAYVEGSNLVLTGIISGTVQPTPAAGQESFYNFGINRGAATAPGPFYGKPKVTFDSVVQVGFTAAGPYATVTTLDVNTGAVTGTTNLPVSSIATKTDAVQVLVPLSALPSTGLPASRYRVSFFPSDKAVPANFNDIASVLPENNTFQVKVLRRYPAFPNGGGTIAVAPTPPTVSNGGGAGGGNQNGNGGGVTMQ